MPHEGNENTATPSAPEDVFPPGGALACALGEAYEFREKQLAMSRLVEDVLRDGGAALIEAGTGIGKTLAYLVPALASGKRVVVSTSTKTLQSQLWEKDLPLLRSALGRDFKAALLKGRKNYLCFWRAKEAHTDGLFSSREEVADFNAVLAWAAETPTGHVSEMEKLPEDAPLWDRLTVSSEECLGRKCGFYDDCFVTRAREKAREADLIVVNHHLYFADLAVRGGSFGEVIPEHDAVIFDEAHALERAATQFFGVSLSRGMFARFVADARRIYSRDKANKDDGGAAAELAALDDASRAYFRAFESDSPSGRVPLRPHLDLPEFRHARTRIESAAGRLAAREDSDEAQALAERGLDIAARADFLASASDANFVYLTERGERGISLHAYPVEVGPILRARVFEKKHAAVLTSATLAVGSVSGGGRGGDPFAFSRARLGLSEESVCRSLESPFDYDSQALLYVPMRIAPPTERERFLAGAADEVEALVAASRGRAFLLFTSFAFLDALYARLRDRLDYPLLRQGDAPRERLLESFRQNRGSVLFGTSSFWEGIDVQGDSLVLVAVDRLPFEVPDDPLLRARLARVEAAGENPFSGYQVPQAALALRQGLGRLIRSRSDRGVLAVLDSRIMTKGYGKIFRDSLPIRRVTRNREEAEAMLLKC